MIKFTTIYYTYKNCSRFKGDVINGYLSGVYKQHAAYQGHSQLFSGIQMYTEFFLVRRLAREINNALREGFAKHLNSTDKTSHPS